MRNTTHYGLKRVFWEFHQIKTVLNYGLPRPGQDLNPIEDPDSETLNDEPRECQSDQRPTSSKGGPGEPYS